MLLLQNGSACAAAGRRWVQCSQPKHTLTSSVAPQRAARCSKGRLGPPSVFLVLATQGLGSVALARAGLDLTAAMAARSSPRCSARSTSPAAIQSLSASSKSRKCTGSTNSFPGPRLLHTACLDA
jgi:hypothetical protein